MFTPGMFTVFANKINKIIVRNYNFHNLFSFIAQTLQLLAPKIEEENGIE